MGIVIYQKSQTEQSSKCKAISRERREKKKIVSLSYIMTESEMRFPQLAVHLLWGLWRESSEPSNKESK